jgi:glycosyltransferase involved in cell wall biosynthesis
MRDNTLVAALAKLGHEALLVPTYTPIRTDEEDVSHGQIFYGGINVYLQQQSWLFRITPWFIDSMFNFTGLLNWVSRFAARTQAQELGELTVSMLQGEHGKQAKEVEKLVQWLSKDLKPEVVNLTNALLCGFVRELKKHHKAPVLVSLQGDDIFTESLPEPYKSQALALIRERAQEIDGFIATSSYYADFMSGYFAVPREKVHVVLPGLNLTGHGAERHGREGRPFTIGYFARICPEKGFHNIVDAFLELRKRPGTEQTRLHASGWLGENNKPFFDEQVKKIKAAGLLADFAHIDCPDHASKVRFLHQLDVLSVPTTYREPKGLYVLEALANGVPVIQPRHGSFSELVEQTGGGVLVQPDSVKELADALHAATSDRPGLVEMGRRGKEIVHTRFTARRMAEETAALYERYLR